MKLFAGVLAAVFPAVLSVNFVTRLFQLAGKPQGIPCGVQVNFVLKLNIGTFPNFARYARFAEDRRRPFAGVF